MEKVSSFLIQIAFLCNMMVLGFWNQCISKGKFLIEYCDLINHITYFLQFIDSKIPKDLKTRLKLINENDLTRYIKFKFICLPIVYIKEHFQKWKMKGKQSNLQKNESKSLSQLIIDLTLLHCDLHDKVVGSLGIFWWIPFFSNLNLFKLITFFFCTRIIELFEY